MKLFLRVTGSDEIMNKCRQRRREVMDLLAPLSERNYGTDIDFLGVNVVFQDTGLLPLGVRRFREEKELDVAVELSRMWIKSASDADIKLALLQCFIKGVEIGKQRLTKNDDFDADRLIADIRKVMNRLEGKLE